MNIKTITCHDVYNYGASLQAYALMKYLQIRGHDVEIIDYKPDYLCRRYKLRVIVRDGFIFNLIYRFNFLHIFLALWQNKTQIKVWKRKKHFDQFLNLFLNLTSVSYHSFEELEADPPQADLFIAGSDQIWNTNYENGRDPSFYLDFVKDPSKCISYAASFATESINDSYVEFVKNKLNNFKSISVREWTGLEISNGLGFAAIHVLDPVFLLEREQWEGLCSKRIADNYILVYDFLRNDPELEKTVRAIAFQLSLKIYSVNDLGTVKYADRNISNAGPIEFLEYIRSAKFVISSSFHATAFAVIFERPFYVFPLVGHNNSSRMKDFTASIGLGYRYIDKCSDIDLNHLNIDYQRINLEKLKAVSFEYLNQFI